MNTQKRCNGLGFARAVVLAIDLVQMLSTGHENRGGASIHNHQAMEAEVRFAGLRIARDHDGSRDIGLRSVVLVVDEARKGFEVYFLPGENLSLHARCFCDYRLDRMGATAGIDVRQFTHGTPKRQCKPPAGTTK